LALSACIHRLGIKCKPPRQSGDCCIARTVGNLDKQILALLSRHCHPLRKSDLRSFAIRAEQSAVARGAWFVIDL
jgi:hypothetical protein